MLLCTVLSGAGLWWPINETEQRLTKSRSLCFPGDPGAVNPASALIEAIKILPPTYLRGTLQGWIVFKALRIF